jgi:uncharacterized protein
MKTLEELAEPLDDHEYDELDAYLLALEDDRAVLNLSEFDGFVTAIVSGPELIAPSEWLPVVLGDSGNAPAVESPEAFSRMVDLMMRHLNTTAATLMEDPRAFEPYFLESRVKGKSYLVVDDWCIGYMKAVMLREDRWLDKDTDWVEILSPIPLFTTPEGWDLLDQLADRHLEYLQSQVTLTARAVHAYWLQRRGEFLPPGGFSIH